MALYKSLILFMPQSRYSWERYTRAITMCHYARAMQCVSLTIILFYLHGVHPCRFCLPRQVSHLQFLINGLRNIFCNCSKFRQIIPPLLPQTTTIIFPSSPVTAGLGSRAAYLMQLKAIGSCSQISEVLFSAAWDVISCSMTARKFSACFYAIAERCDWNGKYTLKRTATSKEGRGHKRVGSSPGVGIWVARPCNKHFEVHYF